MCTEYNSQDFTYCSESGSQLRAFNSLLDLTKSSSKEWEDVAFKII